MNKINCKALFSWLPIQRGYDKVCHFVAGFGITSTVTLIVGLSISITFGAMTGLIVGVLTAVGKEVYDKYRKNGSGFDFFDMFATILGVFFGVIFGKELLKFII